LKNVIVGSHLRRVQYLSLGGAQESVFLKCYK
jgi:hypothetical protein